MYTNFESGIACVGIAAQIYFGLATAQHILSGLEERKTYQLSMRGSALAHILRSRDMPCMSHNRGVRKARPLIVNALQRQRPVFFLGRRAERDVHQRWAMAYAASPHRLWWFELASAQDDPPALSSWEEYAVGSLVIMERPIVGVAEIVADFRRGSPAWPLSN